MWLVLCLVAILAPASGWSQDSQATGTKPPDRVTGTVTAVDHAAHTVQVKEDKTGAEYSIELANTRTLLKVEPTAKDLKNAVRITADDLAPGDRVQVAGSKLPDNPNAIAARSVLLMSARDLQQVHQAQTAEWQHSTAGVVTAVDPSAGQLRISARTPEGPKQMLVNAANAQFSRYSPETPTTPVSSQLADVQPGDQIRIVGDLGSDGETLTARKIYSSSFRTVVGTVSSIASGGNEITIKDLQTKQPVTVALNDSSAIRKLPPMMAYALARRFNPDFKPAAQNGQGQSEPPATPTSRPAGDSAAPDQRAGGRWSNGDGSGQGAASRGGGMRAAASGDLSQILDRLPKISTADLKPGDAVIVSGSPAGADKSHLVATNVIAGVEPIFQSASPRQAQSLSDWGASLSGGSTAETGMPPQ